MWKVAYANNCSIFYHASTKFVTRFTSKINRHGLSSNGASFVGIKKLQQLWSATQDSCNPLHRLKQEKNVFLDLFVQISGQIWTVVGRGYFSHDSSRRKNVASARRVQWCLPESLMWTSLDTPLFDLNRYVLPDKAWFWGSCRSLEQDMNPSGAWSKCVIPTVV